MNLKASRAAALLAALSCSTLLSPTPSFAQAEPAQNEGQKAARGKADRSTYYRVQASYLYRGERVDFDIQVGCNVYVSVGLDRDRSMMTGLAPMAYGLPMKDGGGLVIVPPKACGGETSDNGKIPPNYIPYPITFEDYTKPFEGLGYQSTEAFDSPISKLKFVEAKVTASSKEAFDAWRMTEAPKNIIKPDMLTFKLGDVFQKNGRYNWTPRGYFPDTCLYVNRLKAPPQVAAILQRDRPDEGTVYWTSDKTKMAMLQAIPPNPPGSGRERESWYTYSIPRTMDGAINFGTLTEKKSDFPTDSRSNYYHSGSFYPWRNNFNSNDYLSKWIDRDGSFIDTNIEIINKFKGFSICLPMQGNFSNYKGNDISKSKYKSIINNTPIKFMDWNGSTILNVKSNISSVRNSIVFEYNNFVLFLYRDQFISFGGSL